MTTTNERLDAMESNVTTILELLKANASAVPTVPTSAPAIAAPNVSGLPDWMVNPPTKEANAPIAPEVLYDGLCLKHSKPCRVGVMGRCGVSGVRHKGCTTRSCNRKVGVYVGCYPCGRAFARSGALPSPE